MREVETDTRSKFFNGLKVNGQEIYELRYADDTALISDTKEGLAKLITTVKEHSEMKELKLNVKKTKIMDVNGCRESSEVTVDGEEIESVESFEYLGSLIEADGDGTKEIKRRLAMASKKLTEMKKLWKATNKDMKLRIIRVCIFPTATYGCET